MYNYRGAAVPMTFPQASQAHRTASHARTLSICSSVLWGEEDKMDESSSFGYWLRRRRKALDLTQLDLAQRVGCAKVTIQKIELDARRPSREIALQLVQVLAIPTAEQATFLQ